MAFRVDGVSASYSQWQRSYATCGRSVGKLGPCRVCGVRRCCCISTRRRSSICSSTGQARLDGAQLGEELNVSHLCVCVCYVLHSQEKSSVLDFQCFHVLDV